MNRTFHEILSEFLAKTGHLASNLDLETMVRISKKGDLTFEGLKRGESANPEKVRLWFFSACGIPVPADQAVSFYKSLTSLAQNYVDSQGSGDSESIDKAEFLEGLGQFMVAVAFGSKLKLGIWVSDFSRELRIVDKPEEAIACLSGVRATEFVQWFQRMFRARNLPKADIFLKQGYSFDNPPAPASWLGQDKMENDLTGLLHEARKVVNAEEVVGVSWDAAKPCYYNPIARDDIPVEMVDGKPKLAKRKDGSAYDLATMPEAWEVFESRIHPETRNEWRTQIFSIFAPIGLRGRQVIWGRSPGGKGQSTAQAIIQKRIKEMHSKSTGPSSFEKSGWKFDSADLWNKTLVLVPDVKAEDAGFMRGGLLHNFTGSDIMPIQPKFGRIFNGRTWGKIWVTSNEYPKIEVGAAHAMDRLAMIEFGQVPEEIIDRETIRDDEGNKMLSAQGTPLLRTDFEERLEAQLDWYLAHCFKAWFSATHKMKSPPAHHSRYMNRRIVANCGTSAQAAVEFRWSDYFESGKDFHCSASELNLILGAWRKFDPHVKYETSGFVKWAEAIQISRNGPEVRMEVIDGVSCVVGFRFKGSISYNGARHTVIFPGVGEIEL